MTPTKDKTLTLLQITIDHISYLSFGLYSLFQLYKIIPWTLKIIFLIKVFPIPDMIAVDKVPVHVYVDTYV